MEFAEPTAKQCSQRLAVGEDEHKFAYALWYPQMGGYVAKAIAVFDKNWTDIGNVRSGGCIELYIWHNGDFPFGDGNNPAHLHHCDSQQFIDFGKTLTVLNAKGRTTPPQREPPC